MTNKLNMKEASTYLNVHPCTLRRWEETGKLVPEKTLGGHRRYDLASLQALLGKDAVEVPETGTITIGYARVSTAEQKNDLFRQAVLLETYCASHGWSVELIMDTGSGMNYHKKGLTRLLDRICSGKVDRLVLAHKDRLLRFGAELVFALCERFGTEVVIINVSENSTFEEDLATDVLEIITVFSARLYGSRSRKNKVLLDKFAETALAVQEG